MGRSGAWAFCCRRWSWSAKMKGGSTACADPPSGERGIRTLDTRFHVCRFSKPVPSASRPSLRESLGSYWRTMGSTTLLIVATAISKHDRIGPECWRNSRRACIHLDERITERGMSPSYTAKAATLLSLAALIAAASSPLSVVEYQIPREQAFPHDPAVGRDGIVWYTDQANSFIGRL